MLGSQVFEEVLNLVLLLLRELAAGTLTKGRMDCIRLLHLLHFQINLSLKTVERSHDITHHSRQLFEILVALAVYKVLVETAEHSFILLGVWTNQFSDLRLVLVEKFVGRVRRL